MSISLQANWHWRQLPCVGMLFCCCFFCYFFVCHHSELTTKSILCVLTYETLNMSVPPYLSQRINGCLNAWKLRSSATPLLIQPFARTDFAKRCFRCSALSRTYHALCFQIQTKTILFQSSKLLLPVPLKLQPYGTFVNMFIIIIILLLVVEKAFFVQVD